QRRVVKLMAADHGAGRSEWAVGKKAGLTVAKLQLAAREACGMAEQPSHGVTNVIGVIEALAEHHVAAAFAMDRPRLRKARQSGAKAHGVCERAGVELGVSAGQPAAVAALRGRLVAERGERDDLGAGAAPAFDEVRIDEGESLIAGERDALPRRRQS